MCEICGGSGLSLSRRAVLAAFAPALAACVTNPTTGRSQLILVDDAQLQQASLQAWSQERQRNPIWNNPQQQARLTRVGQTIARVANVPNAQWEFALFDRPDKNAYVLPGGKVGFYCGLMEICDRDDHVATVLGHEVGHVVARHAAERMSQQIAEQGALSVAGAVTSSQIAQAALGLGVQIGIALPFSRAQESEADRVGVGLMHASGYDVRQSLVFWTRMAEGGGRPPEMLSTHPSPQTRMADLRAYINAQGWGPV